MQVIGAGASRMLVVSVSLIDADGVDVALAAISRAAATIARDAQPGLGFEILRYRLLVRTYLSLQSVAGRAGSVAAWARRGDSGTLGALVRRIRDVEPATVRAVAEQMLEQGEGSIRIAKHDAAARLDAWAALPPLPAGAGPGAAPPTPTQVALDLPSLSARLHDARSFTLDNGMRVVLFARPSALVPVVSGRLIFTAGSAHEPADSAGLADAVAHLLEIEERHYTIGAISFVANPLNVAGAVRGVTVSADATTFAADALDESLPQVLEGLEGWATGTIDRAESLEVALLRHLAADILPHLVDRALAELVEQRVYGAGHPYAPHALGPAPFERLANGGLLAAWQRGALHAGNAILVVTGKFDPAQAEPLIRSMFGAWPRGPAAEAVARPAAPEGGRFVVGVASERTQADLAIAFPGGAAHDANEPVRLVLGEILAREMRAIRDRLGASYGVAAGYQLRVGPGMYGIGGQVDRERLAEVMALVDATLAAVRTEAGAARTLADAKRTVTAELIADLDSAPAQAAAIAQLAAQRLPLDRWLTLAAAVRGVTAAEVAALAAAELAPDREVIVVRAPQGALDALRKHGFTVKLYPTEGKPE